MHFVKNLHPSYSILFSLLASAGLSVFLSGGKQIIAFLGIYVGIVVWLLATVHIIRHLFVSAGSKKTRPNILKISCFFFGKLLLLWGVFYMGWQFMGKELFIALLNLPVQIFILVPGLRISREK